MSSRLTSKRSQIKGGAVALLQEGRPREEKEEEATKRRSSLICGQETLTKQKRTEDDHGSPSTYREEASIIYIVVCVLQVQ